MKIFFKYWFPVLLYAILIFGISSIPAHQLSGKLILPDYILHIIEYLPFGFLVFRALKGSKGNLPFKKIFLFSICLAVLYALSDEMHQLFVPGRDASVWDLLCDSIGAVIGAKIAA